MHILHICHILSEVGACQQMCGALAHMQQNSFIYDLFWACMPRVARTGWNQLCRKSPAHSASLTLRCTTAHSSSINLDQAHRHQAPGSGQVLPTRPTKHNTRRNAYVTADTRNACVALVLCNAEFGHQLFVQHRERHAGNIVFRKELSLINW